MLAVGVAFAQEPKAAPPAKEHLWLKQLEGEWIMDGEAIMAPDQPAIKCKGTESVKMLGGFWAMGVMKCDMMGAEMTGHMTIGYDTQKKKFIGTFVCSMAENMFTYDGKLEGNTLTLECEGPDPTTGKNVKMRDVIEVKGKDAKALTSYIQAADGKWNKFMTMNYKRK
jgi:hypothetical protein